MIEHSKQMRVTGCSPELQKDGLVGKIKCKSNVLELSTVSNADLLAALAIPAPVELHGRHTIRAALHLAEDHTLAVQPLTLGSADEKLGTVFVRCSICHGQDAGTCVLQDEILIIKFLPVDGFSLCVIMACEITTLAHKSQSNSVKAGNFVTKSFLASARSTKVFCCLWNFANSSKETWPKGSPSAGISKNTEGLTKARSSGAATSARPLHLIFTHLRDLGLKGYLEHWFPNLAALQSHLKSFKSHLSWMPRNLHF